MSRKHTALFAVAALVGGFLAAQGAFAQQGPTTPPSGGAPQAQQPGQGMMGGMMGMMNMMGQMDPAQMNRMMENCNAMMGSMMGPPSGPGTSPPAAPAPGQPQRG